MEYLIAGFISLILAVVKLTLWTSLGWFWVFLPLLAVCGIILIDFD